MAEPTLAELTTLRVGGPARRVLAPSTEAELIEAVAGCDAAGEPLLVRWSAPANGVSLLLTPPQDQPVTLRWAVISDGWPQGAAPLPARPGDVAPWGASDSLVVIGERVLTAD